MYILYIFDLFTNFIFSRKLLKKTITFIIISKLLTYILIILKFSQRLFEIDYLF